MKLLTVLLRLGLGTIFVIYGLDGFFHFMPPHPTTEKADAFVSALIDSGFLWQVMKGTQVVAGGLLLADWFVPLALVLLAPIIAIIFLMQLFIDPAGLPVGTGIGVLELALAWLYRDYFKHVLVRKAVPTDVVSTELEPVAK